MGQRRRGRQPLRADECQVISTAGSSTVRTFSTQPVASLIAYSPPGMSVLTGASSTIAIVSTPRE